ncbi:MAG TPA: NAD(P)/FAD-dependent oxidoreductase [Baekduia sp.]|uniref:NAD(P)/FAD-dependent oxidoreductase n=1 Tax=Baekduia sp. TaxID=2600305 RepID=UPI002D7814F6|nr:NAD(P)/FAD-dependent oxidoreductase [Baekduia sp.]HET6509059.1 NAD(P)/FAD-dependent oxidoreductase [Baekduia sp.]
MAVGVHRVVIVGSGFAGLFAARRLEGAPCEVTVVDRRTYHLFQPLLYQVATGILSEGDVAPPTREVLRRQPNARVVLGEVVDVDAAARVVTARSPVGETALGYDSLIVAAGSAPSYFGHDEFAVHAPGLKSLDDALEVRGRIFGAFEMAESEPDPERRAAWLTFALVGAGPTGVELAGQIAELSRQSLRGRYRAIDPATARIVLLDGAPRILPAFDERLSARAADRLRELGVEIEPSAMVVGVDADGIDVQGSDGARRRLVTRTKVWSAGVQASPLGALLARRAGAALGRHGQVEVEPDCTLPGHPEIFVVGDLMSLDGLPGLAEVAMQSGLHAASEIDRRLGGDPRPRRFQYRDLGSLAAISRGYAIGQRGRVQVWGRPGWVIWLTVHLVFLTGFKSRVAALFHWVFSLFGRARYEQSTTLRQVTARTASPSRPG